MYSIAGRVDHRQVPISVARWLGGAARCKFEARRRTSSRTSNAAIFAKEGRLRHYADWKMASRLAARFQSPQERLRPLLGLSRGWPRDRKSTRLNSSHLVISYAV